MTASQACPWVLEAQPSHAPPEFPHALTPVPAVQMPPVQHPPLHGCVDGLHCTTQRCVVVSHALPAGQSENELHPQNVLPPLVMHCAPAALDAQLVHAGSPLLTAHAPPVVPATHVPALQQPPLHARFPAHDVEHACVTGLHACPARQSVALVQPPPPSTPASPAPVSLPPGPVSDVAASPGGRAASASLPASIIGASGGAW